MRSGLSLIWLLVLVFAGAAIAPQRVAAQAKSPQYAAIVIDARNGKTLHAENADSRRYPASLTKMMTLYFVFEAMKAGKLTPDAMLPVSAMAEAQAPTKLWLREGQSISVQDAIHGLIIVSANDASTVIAEHFGGTQENFALMMTKKARSLGMMSTVFRNPNGLPDMGQFTTARDMATLSMALRQNFPEYYHLFSVQEFKFRGRQIKGHNRLVGAMKGVDGLKTGFTNASRFNLATSYSEGEQKLVVVVLGGMSAGARDARVAELINAYSGRLSGSTQLVAKANTPEEPDPEELAAREGEAQIEAEGKPVARASDVHEDAPQEVSREAPQEIDATPVAAIPQSWAVQLKPEPRIGIAKADMAKARKAWPALGATKAEVSSVTADGAKAYRAQFSGFATKAAAERACVALKDLSAACEVVGR